MENKFDFENDPHRRFNILTGEWVLVSPHRTKRPWQGKVEKVNISPRPSYDEGCYLCPGNSRVGGHKNPNYEDTFVFENDFSAILKDTPEGDYNVDNLLIASSESGICRVINFSPDHSLTLAQMKPSAIRRVVDTWIEQFVELSKMPGINHVQIFENKGDIMGNSNPHPHGQIWAQKSIPVEPLKKTQRQRDYWQSRGSGLLYDYLNTELKLKERLVYENEHFAVLVPFWAIWPYETMILPKRMMSDISMMNNSEKDSFADAIKAITSKYDHLFEVSFPYSAGIHQSPCDDQSYDFWHWHMVFYPPLLRSASVKKFMVGYEMMANPQRDITAEYSAKRLREL